MRIIQHSFISKIMNQLLNFSNKSRPLFLVLSLFLLAQSFFSCATKSKNSSKIVDSPVLITYSKEGTRGLRNPLYTIEILEGKVAKYTGIANVPVIGERLIELDKKEYQTIIQKFEGANFTAFETVYKGKMRDLPLTSITFNKHKITYQPAVCPEKLMDLAEIMERLVPTF